jgi:glycosyltransferase involved in cell wall biosynthesis
MMAGGRPCEACDHGRYFNAMKLRCVKDSTLRSALVSMELYLHHSILDAYKYVDVFIAPSVFLKKKHEQMGFHKKMVHLPYPLDVKEFDEVHADSNAHNDNKHITFAYFGRLEPEKGLYTLFEAIKHLHKSSDSTVFNIIGEGPIKDKLREFASRNKMDNVRFRGFFKGKELFTEIKTADIIIIPSEWYENYPVSVMEAFALGKPVIGARIGGIPEMVKDNETGLTFESGNPVDLREKIQYVIDNPKVIPPWGKNARQFIEQEVNPERHYQQLMEIYELAMSGKH